MLGWPAKAKLAGLAYHLPRCFADTFGGHYGASQDPFSFCLPTLALTGRLSHSVRSGHLNSRLQPKFAFLFPWLLPDALFSINSILVLIEFMRRKLFLGRICAEAKVPDVVVRERGDPPSVRPS